MQPAVERVVRPYRPEDSDACLAVFDRNVPTFFGASERPDFVRFLLHHAAQWHYCVVERCGEVVGCAGHSISLDGRTASLGWGMVDPALHGQGLGTKLLLARLDAVRLTPGVERIVLDTSQHTQGFYARFGFVATAVTPDGYGAGLDRWDMALEL
ncbi:GNAT family N-acetyltransferase [Stenotrophomonas sp. C3(2023)]|uniref:GNAT family N-acetyltransferase n=1 Tax=Stenotrophomonas sp. C3(2023) TaxID=3080277 RepID=UPI00293D006A|nr:GNAT family N-acetyltransferase [Stenotrophomonas sp. C3(2023)]MDV3468426.1 GNAT family N-acetyltransferase [Stenotrophomonas sp. C3(2023)]